MGFNFVLIASNNSSCHKEVFIRTKDLRVNIYIYCINNKISFTYITYVLSDAVIMSALYWYKGVQVLWRKKDGFYNPGSTVVVM